MTYLLSYLLTNCAMVQQKDFFVHLFWLKIDEAEYLQWYYVICK